MNEEQNVVGHQATQSEDLYREEVDPGQRGQMRLNEFLPRRVLAPFWQVCRKIRFSAALYFSAPSSILTSREDKATFERPHQYAVGFKDVVINGKAIIGDGELTKERSGRILYGPAKQ